MKYLISACVCVMLSGCFFDNKTEPVPPKQTQSGQLVIGTISMTDVHGVEAGAITQADFGLFKVEEEKAIARWRRSIATQATASSSPCTVQRKPKKTQKTLKATFQDVVGVGRLGFAEYGTSDLLEITEGKEHHYALELKEHVPSGMYQYAAEGKDRAPKFQELLSMPEDLTKVVVNGFDFATDPVNIKKSENIKASWNSTSHDSEKDSIMLIVGTETDDEYIDLNCKVQERTLPKTDNMTTWEIKKTEFQDLPITGSKLGVIALYRYHILERNTKEPVLQMAGIRIYNTVAGVGE